MKKMITDIMKSCRLGQADNKECLNGVLALVGRLGLIDNVGSVIVQFEKIHHTKFEVGTFKGKSDYNLINDIDVNDEINIYISDGRLVSSWVYNIDSKEIKFDCTEQSVYVVE